MMNMFLCLEYQCSKSSVMAPFGRQHETQIISIQRPHVFSKVTILEGFVLFWFVTLGFKVVADDLRQSEKIW